MDQHLHTIVDDWKGFSILVLILVMLGVIMIKLSRKEDVWTDLNRWVGELATTNWKIFVGIILAIGTMFFYFGSEMRCIGYKIEATCRPIDSTNFGLWLAFVGAWAGVATYQFKIKRDTYAAPSPDSERAGVSPIPAPTTPSAPEPQV